MNIGMEPHGDRVGVGSGDLITQEVYGRVFRYLGKLCAGHTELAEELTQETMVRLLRSHGQLRDSTASAWITRACPSPKSCEGVRDATAFPR